MTRTFPGSGDATEPPRSASRPTLAERVIVLGSFAAAALWTAVSFKFGTGTEAIGPLWLAAIAWAVVSSLALALRRGIRNRDWSAFRGNEFPDNSDHFDWSTKTGRYAYLRIAEEHQRLMRGD